MTVDAFNHKFEHRPTLGFYRAFKVVTKFLSFKKIYCDICSWGLVEHCPPSNHHLWNFAGLAVEGVI